MNTLILLTQHIEVIRVYQQLNSNASNQNVNVFTQKQTDNSKIVAWAISTGSGFVRKKLTEIAT